MRSGRMIHMAETASTLEGLLYVRCRCGWMSEPDAITREQARRDGDAHLAETNGTPR